MKSLHTVDITKWCIPHGYFVWLITSHIEEEL